MTKNILKKIISIFVAKVPCAFSQNHIFYHELLHFLLHTTNYCMNYCILYLHFYSHLLSCLQKAKYRYTTGPPQSPLYCVVMGILNSVLNSQTSLHCLFKIPVLYILLTMCFLNYYLFPRLCIEIILSLFAHVIKAINYYSK